MPTGGAMAAVVLLRLAALTGEGRYRTAAERAIRTVTPYAERYPTAFAQWLSAIDFALSDAVEIAIVGDPRDVATRALLEPVATGYRPNQVLAVAADPEGSFDPAPARPRSDRWGGYRLRMPRVHLQDARDRRGGPSRAARGAGACRLTRPRRPPRRIS